MLGLVLLIGIGLVVGGLANFFFTPGGGMGNIGNLLAAVAGSLLGGMLFQAFGESMTGWVEDQVLLASYAVAFVGAVLMLFIVGLIKKIAT
ncbi:MAG TPA: GlsB/YeaQ/YmgE family stress response membrane protein [Pyrinomonadaceae bacterium]